MTKLNQKRSVKAKEINRDPEILTDKQFLVISSLLDHKKRNQQQIFEALAGNGRGSSMSALHEVLRRLSVRKLILKEDYWKEVGPHSQKTRECRYQIRKTGHGAFRDTLAFYLARAGKMAPEILAEIQEARRSEGVKQLAKAYLAKG